MKRTKVVSEIIPGNRYFAVSTLKRGIEFVIVPFDIETCRSEWRLSEKFMVEGSNLYVNSLPLNEWVESHRDVINYRAAVTAQLKQQRKERNIKMMEVFDGKSL